MLAIGDLLADEYRIEGLVGKGGMGCIYRAVRTEADGSKRHFAVKEMSAQARDAAGRTVQQGVSRQISLMKRVSHPAIVKIEEAFSWNGRFYIVSELVEGRSLQSIVHCEGAQSEQTVVAWALSLCDALGYLHGLEPPIVYRDMKPSNVMLLDDGSLKLVDLGIAREYKEDAEQGKDTVTFGTQGYAPPEQYGRAQTDGRSDIYALGATLWHLLAGYAPPTTFPLPDVRTAVPQVSEGLATIIARCTALDRDARFQTCEELAQALRVPKKDARKNLKSRIAYAVRALSGKSEVSASAVAARPTAEGAFEGELPTATLVSADEQRDSLGDFFFVVVQSEVVTHG